MKQQHGHLNLYRFI